MKLRTFGALVALPMVTAFTLSGCALLPSAPQPAAESSAPTASPTPTAEPTEEPSSGTATSGDVAEPGTTVGPGEELVYEFTGTDEQKALISAALVDVTPATAEQVAFLNEQFDEDELKGLDISFIHVTQKKVSGDPVEFNADYTSFKPVDAEGQRVQDVTVIGWDECGTESFTPEFDAGVAMTQCYIAASPTGGNAPAGVMYEGGYEEGNPYSSYDGEPLLFLVD
jgi:hypothetical protein